MLSDPVALIASAHKGLRVSQKGSVEDIADNQMVKVFFAEFVVAAADYPIVFVLDEAADVYTAAVMWGLEPGENLFVQNNEWIGGFIPASVRCYPFTMTVNSDVPDKLLVGLYDKSSILSKEEGELIFNDDGTETEWMKKTGQFLVAAYEEEQLSRNIIKELQAMGLLISQTLSYTRPGEEQARKVDGFFVVDQAKLAELSDEDFLKLRKMNVLEAISAHFSSLSKSDKLLQLKLQPA